MAEVGKRTVQTVVVARSRGTRPSLRLSYPDTLVAPDDPALDRLRPALPGMLKAFAEALSAAPARTEVGPTEDEWAFPLRVRLGLPEKAALNALEGEMAIPCVATLDGARTAKWLLMLEAPGRIVTVELVVIDFGATNSTVTIHDIQMGVPFVGLPEEQEHHLRGRWAEWLRPEAASALPPQGQRFESDWKNLRTQTARSLNVSGELPAWLGG